MATVRCPNCGAINPNGRRLLARCRQCRAYMAACRFCVHYDRRMMDCIHPARPEELRITDPSESLNCSDFSSIADTPWGRARILRIARTAFFVLALAFGGIFGGARLYEAAITPPPPVLLDARVVAPEEVFRDAGYSVKIFVRNYADVAAEDVQVLLSGPMMHKLVCEDMDPPEAFIDAGPRVVSAWIGRIEPGEIGQVTFYFTPKEATDVKLRAQITAANLECPEQITIAGNILP